jgi:hypothetical protein
LAVHDVPPVPPKLTGTVASERAGGDSLHGRPVRGRYNTALCIDLDVGIVITSRWTNAERGQSVAAGRTPQDPAFGRKANRR